MSQFKSLINEWKIRTHAFVVCTVRVQYSEVRGDVALNEGIWDLNEWNGTINKQLLRAASIVIRTNKQDPIVRIWVRRHGFFKLNERDRVSFDNFSQKMSLYSITGQVYSYSIHCCTFTTINYSAYCIFGRSFLTIRVVCSAQEAFSFPEDIQQQKEVQILDQSGCVERH